jgi:hypothetical protein
MAQTTYGIRLTKGSYGSRYYYKGVMYQFGQDVEVDRALRDTLVGGGHFTDVLIDKPDPDPIPVASSAAPKKRGRPKGSGKKDEAGLRSPEGGATATRNTDSDDHPDFDDAEAV